MSKKPRADPFTLENLCQQLHESTLATFLSGDWQAVQLTIDWLGSRKNPKAIEIFQNALEPKQRTGLLVMLMVFRGTPEDRAEIMGALEPLVAADKAEAQS